MENFNGCQLTNIPKLSEGLVRAETQSFRNRLRRTLAAPWNYHVKRWLKQGYRIYLKALALIRPLKEMKPAQVELSRQAIDQLPRVEDADSIKPGNLAAGDWVRVRSRAEIQAMLDPFKETRGCAFLEDMYKYCDTRQRVLKSMERFLDERDYQVKKVRGVILLENVICNGTPAFGKCDRCCFLFWREEWLEKTTR